jgi:colanic acid biosynthesis glycosyl transferase WcaI
MSLGLVAPLLDRPDLILSTSPSFPALLPGLLATKFRRIPWFIWLQDILPDGAVATGYLDDADPVIRASRLLERAAYRSARGIFVLSDSFRQNLLAKNVPPGQITVVYNPATLSGPSLYDPDPSEPPRVLCMGNIGRSQGLAEIVRNFESNPELEALGARLVVAGSGVAEQEVKSAITTDRVEMTGLLDEEGVKSELRRASLAAVTQSYDAGEFNVPSKLMNYLATGMPVVGSVSESGEAARIIRQSESGWISSPGMFGTTVVAALRDREELRRRSRNGHRFARENLSPAALADTFESQFRATLPSI